MGWLCVGKTSYLLVAAVLFSSQLCLATSFPRKTIKLKSKVISVEVADTDERRAQGLMGRMEMGVNEGMLFEFTSEKTRTFWMKDTFIPLTIAFFDKFKALIETQDMSPVSLAERPVTPKKPTYPTYRSRRPAKYALEMNKGWFRKNGIEVGDRFTFVKNSNNKSNKR